jgi:hypothetical protein
MDSAYGFINSREEREKPKGKTKGKQSGKEVMRYISIEVPRPMCHVPRNECQFAWELKISSQVLIVLTGTITDVITTSPPKFMTLALLTQTLTRTQRKGFSHSLFSHSSLALPFVFPEL